jgi:hypothetical protein
LPYSFRRCVAVPARLNLSWEHTPHATKGTNMNDDTNIITVSLNGANSNGVIDIVMTGPLTQYTAGMARYIRMADGIAGTELFAIPDGILISVTLKPPGERDTIDYVRVRVRDRCRSWCRDVTGIVTNLAEAGIHVDLVEESPLVP